MGIDFTLCMRWIVTLLLPLMIVGAVVFWYLLFSGQLFSSLGEGGRPPGDGSDPSERPSEGSSPDRSPDRRPSEEGGSSGSNELGSATSPYLLQHADNPVAWKAWGESAFERARREDKPIFLSVGYSTCHWCHVMAHESFEDPETAALLNEHFVPVKVDREQLPDVDGHYMLATQAFYMLAGQPRGGGWPNSVWLMPDGRPFYAGTYFPRPQFVALLIRLADLWRGKRGALEQNAVALEQAIESMSAVRGPEGVELSAGMVDEAVGAVGRMFDERHGGFGGAPKFPPHGLLDLIERRITRGGDHDPADGLRRMYLATLDAMQRGGVYDHVGGGFHRYATDDRWFLPHFEKMLYDNGPLLARYGAAYRLTGDERHRRTVARTFGWLERRMIEEGGGFYSAMDADSEGEEGRYYVWGMDELRDVLGPDWGEAGVAEFASVYGMAEEGNWIDEATGAAPGTNIPYLERSIESYAEAEGKGVEALRERLEAMRAKLLEARRRRVPPHTDDKVLAGWNGLMIEGLAEAGAAFGERRYIDAAASAAEFVLRELRDEGGGLRRSWRAGRAEGEGYLDDYAYMIGGLLALDAHDAPVERAGEDVGADEVDGVGASRWLAAARELAGGMVERFEDERHGGFYYTTGDPERGGPALLRSKSPHAGGNTPSPNGRAARGLLTLAERTGEADLARRAMRTLRLFAGQMAQYPHGSEDLLIALDRVANDERLASLAGFEEAGAAPATERGGPIEATLETPDAPAAQGQSVDVTLRLRIDAPYHVYGPEPGSGELKPTRVALVDGSQVEMGRPRYPEPIARHDPASDQTLEVYEGEVEIVVPLTIRASEEGAARFAVRVEAQPCDERACLLPVMLEVEGAIPVAG